MQPFMFGFIPYLPDSLLTGDWVEAWKFNVVAVCRRLGEHSLVSLSSSHWILFFILKISSHTCLLSMIACCCSISIWVASISFRRPSLFNGALVLPHAVLAYSWTWSLPDGGHVVSMLDMSGQEHTELEWEE